MDERTRNGNKGDTKPYLPDIDLVYHEEISQCNLCSTLSMGFAVWGLFMSALASWLHEIAKGDWNFFYIILMMIAYLPGFLAIVCGIVGISQCRKRRQHGTGEAILGMTIGVLAPIVWFLFTS